MRKGPSSLRFDSHIEMFLQEGILTDKTVGSILFIMEDLPGFDCKQPEVMLSKKILEDEYDNDHGLYWYSRDQYIEFMREVVLKLDPLLLHILTSGLFSYSERCDALECHLPCRTHCTNECFSMPSYNESTMICENHSNGEAVGEDDDDDVVDEVE